MGLDHSTFDYLKPTDEQLSVMAGAREATKQYADALQKLLPDGPDKTYTLRKVRECGMWADVTITRQADGSPRKEHEAQYNIDFGR